MQPQTDSPPETDWPALEAILERFERARGDSVVDLRSYLPQETDPLYTLAAAEMVRVDMERCWDAGDSRRLSSYREITPGLFLDAEALSQVAFEEFRLRRQAGEPASPDEYSNEYGVSTKDWPSQKNSDTLTESAENEARYGSAAYPSAGDTFAGFRLIREIGRGAFARVYLAEQDDLARRNVVLKLSRSRSSEPTHLARLQHTNIVPIYSEHRAQGLSAICMPYHGERTLASVLRPQPSGATPESIAGALVSTHAFARDATVLAGDSSAAQSPNPVGEPLAAAATAQHTTTVIALVRDIALGLSHAHERGIVHRDLKPANVLLADDGRPMLLDFNLSDDAAVNGLASLTVGGTLPYMAPEHLRAVQRGGEVGAQADVFSLGVVLFELLTARRPYPDREGQLDDVLVQCIKDREGQAPQVRTHNPATTRSIEALVQKCLAPSQSERYQSADDLAEDLTRHLNDLPLKHAPNPSLVERAAKWRRRHPRAVSAGSVGVVAALLLAMVAALWTARSARLARLEALQHFSEFEKQLPQARLALSLPDSDRSLLSDGLATVGQTVSLYMPTGVVDWRELPEYARLPDSDQQLLGEQLAEMCYLQAHAERVLAEHDATENSAHSMERALEYNSAAIDALGIRSFALDSQRSDLLGLLGRSDQAASLAVPQTPANSLDDYLAVRQLLGERSFAAAAEKLELLRDKHPTDPVVWLLLGNAWGGMGRVADADAALSAAVALEPRSCVALVNRGLCRMQRGDPTAAAQDFDAVLAMRPGQVCALLNRAIAYESLGDNQLALIDLDAAIATGQAPPRALLLRSRIRKATGDAQGALADHEQAMAARPVDDTGWVARGVARLADSPEAALADFQQALRLNPSSEDALKNIVHVAADRLNRPDDARAAIDQWLEIDPGNPNALAGRAVLAARSGNRDAAHRDVKAALAGSREPSILLQAACVYSLTAGPDNQDQALALQLLSSAADQNPMLLVRAMQDPDLMALRKSQQFGELLSVYRQLGELKRRLNNTP